MGHLYSLSRKEKLKTFGVQLITAVGLSLLFVAVYGSTNYLSSIRENVGSLNFQWEQYIPFIPILIIPYMSIDLFFFCAPFLLKDREELKLFAKRIIAGILIAGTVFLIKPFRFAYSRPEAPAMFKPIFDMLYGFDRPFNLFPSLHIILRTILAYTYTRKSKGILKWTLAVWFSLIGFSTVFTYQHHVMDVIGGFIVAALVFYFIRETPLKKPVIKNRRVGVYYGLLSAALFTAAVLFKSWAFLFLWPAFSCFMVCLGYFGLGPGIYRKENGKIPFSSAVLLLPCLIGQRFSLLYYKQGCKAWDELAPNIRIGRHLNTKGAASAAESGVTAVLDLTTAFSEPEAFRQTEYCNMQVLDLTAPTEDQLTEGAEFIEKQRNKGIVYIHCKIGYSRTAGIAAAWLLRYGGCRNYTEAFERLRSVRPSIIIRPEIHDALKDFSNAG